MGLGVAVADGGGEEVDAAGAGLAVGADVRAGVDVQATAMRSSVAAGAT